MHQKVLAAPAIILLLSLLPVFTFGQSVIRFTTLRAGETEDTRYREHFKTYTLATLPATSTSDLLRSRAHFDDMVLEFMDQSYSFALTARDIRPAHYKLRYLDTTGVHVAPRTPNKTYYGFTSQGGYDVRITADDNFFYALIEQGDDAIYIEPARNIVPSAPIDQFVIYRSSDNLKKMTTSQCGVHEGFSHPHHEAEELITEEIENRQAVCKVVQMALANDFLMFQQEGSVAEVENHNLAVMNNVETNYDDEFSTDLQLDVVEIFVVTTSTGDPWTNSTNSNALLDDFTDWGPGGFDNAHDLGGLWTNRDFNGDVVGLAYLDAVCTPFRYHTVQDFTNNANFLRVLQAHEMGHNFASNHDAAGSPHIMAPTVQNTSTWSTQSVNAINAFIPTRACLSLCTGGSAPIADFDADDTNGCAPFTVHFSDESQNNPTSWSWTFQGGTPATSTQANPTVVYNNPGVFDVSLTVSNAQGSHTLNRNDYITVGVFPEADFDYDTDELFVDFDNLSDNATSYSWDFGDGGTSVQTNPTHEYDEDGVYTVTLTATNACGSDVYTVEIEVTSLPFADFDADNTEGCSPLEVEFINFSSSNSNTFLWTFPGGIPSSSTAFEPTVIYENPGTYHVTLRATNAAGNDITTINNFITLLPEPFATFTSTTNGLQAVFNSAGSLGNTYLWNFGDGETSTQANPTHIYEEGGVYTVTLTMTNTCGTDVDQAQVNITSAPVADFTSNATTGCTPFVVQYTNQSSGTINTFSWVFQGGTPATSNLPNPVVTYFNPGVFDVTLTVTNSVGSDVHFLDNYITANPEPVSAFSVDVDGMDVFLTNLSDNFTSSSWDFGDGFTSNLSDPVHTYNEGGVYTITLTVSGPCGEDISTTQVTIDAPAIAEFSFTQNNSCVPATVQFQNTSSGGASSYKWTFEGGIPAMSTQENPVVTYTTAGTFDVQLIAFGPAGNDTITMNSLITTGIAPTANFLITTNGTSIELENLSANANSFEWYFGDGGTSTVTSPEHTFEEFGSYTIMLIASNNCGDDTSELQIVLGTFPNASFISDLQSGCAPFEVQFIDQSQNNPTSWSWTFIGGTPSTSTLQHPVVVYENPGNYSVTLQVTNSQGTDVMMLTELITVANQPDATFTHTVEGDMVSLFYPGGDFDSLRWDFGDGRIDHSLNPTVQFTTPGDYEITLTVYNACGTSTYSSTVTIETNASHDPQINSNKWQIRPTPFADDFTLYGEPVSGGSVMITLTDVHGKMISREEWNYGSGVATKKMNGDHLPAGIILVLISGEEGTTVLKALHQ